MSIGKTKMGAKTKAQVEMRSLAGGNHNVKGKFHVECYGKDGKLKWVEDTHNIVTTENQDNILDVYYNESTQILTWFIALSESNQTPALTQTYATPAYTESTAFDETTRVVWQADAASGNSMTNSTSADHTMNATKTIYGCGLVGSGAGTSAGVKGNTTSSGGVLACYAAFTGGSRAVVDDDVLKVTYTVTAADDSE